MTKRIDWLPGLDTLRRYELHDIVAGLVLATIPLQRDRPSWYVF